MLFMWVELQIKAHARISKYGKITMMEFLVNTLLPKIFNHHNVSFEKEKVLTNRK